MGVGVSSIGYFFKEPLGLRMSVAMCALTPNGTTTFRLTMAMAMAIDRSCLSSPCVGTMVAVSTGGTRLGLRKRTNGGERRPGRQQVRFRRAAPSLAW